MFIASWYCKYIRREIRALFDEDREAFFSAMEVLYQVDVARCGLRRYLTYSTGVRRVGHAAVWGELPQHEWHCHTGTVYDESCTS
jgi:response regulator of citrate/malate metabolism